MAETFKSIKIIFSILTVFTSDFQKYRCDKTELWIHCSCLISQGHGGKDDGKSSGELTNDFNGRKYDIS